MSGPRTTHFHTKGPVKRKTNFWDMEFSKNPSKNRVSNFWETLTTKAYDTPVDSEECKTSPLTETYQQ